MTLTLKYTDIHVYPVAMLIIITVHLTSHTSVLQKLSKCYKKVNFNHTHTCVSLRVLFVS